MKRKAENINSTYTLQHVTTLINRGQYPEARDACIKISKKNKNNADVWMMLGMIYGSLNNFSLATENFKKALKLSPANAMLYYNLGLALLNSERDEDAIKSFRKALGLNSGMLEARYYLAVALQSNKEYIEAERIFLELLEANPDLAADINTRLSILCLATDRVDEALEFCEKAIVANSAFVGAQIQMGRVLNATGRYEEALAYFQKIIQVDPDIVENYIGLGDSYVGLGRMEDAEKYYLQAYKLKPGDVQVLSKLGTTYLIIGRPFDAIKYLEDAIKIDPSNSEINYNYGDALETSGREEEALKAYNNCYKLNPEFHTALAGVAHILEKKRRFDEAFELIEPLVIAGNRDFRVLTVYADLLVHFGREPEAISILEDFLSSENAESRQTAIVHFHLGKILDASKDYDKAFKHFSLGNKNQYNYSISGQVNSVNNWINGFTPDNIRKMPSSTIKGKKLIFIVGMPRSGTTLTEQIISAHSDVYGAGELIDVGLYAKELQERLGSQFQKHLVDVEVGAIDELTQRYFSKINKLAGSESYVTDKMPHNFQFLGLIQLLFPDARVIHCNRNPIDICLSIYSRLFSTGHSYATDLTLLGQYYCEYKRIMNHWKEVLTIPIMDIHYKSLVNDNENSIRKILEFCDLPWEDDCLNFHKSKRYVNTPSYDQVRQPVYTKSIARWRNYEKHLGDLIVALGEYAEYDSD